MIREGASGDGCWDPEEVVMVVLAEVGESIGGRGRKLQAVLARWETRVKISEMRRCWIVVSYVLCC